MRASSCVVVLVALSAATGAFAQSGKSPGRRERRTTITPLQPQTLPAAVTLPAPLDDNKKPSTFPLAMQEAADLQFIPSDVPSYTRWKVAKTGSIYGRLETANHSGTVRLARDISQNYYRGPSFSVGCSNDGGAPANIYRVLALRWERITSAPDGSTTLEINDGWFDGRDCKAYVERRSTFPLKPVLKQDDIPVLFASRTEDGILFHFPPVARVVSDVEGSTAAHSGQGSLWSIHVPIRKGQAASVLAEMNPRDVAQWMQHFQPAAPPRKGEPAAPSRPLQLGVEVLQTVRDEAPTILLRQTS